MHIKLYGLYHILCLSSKKNEKRSEKVKQKRRETSFSLYYGMHGKERISKALSATLALKYWTGLFSIVLVLLNPFISACLYSNSIFSRIVEVIWLHVVLLFWCTFLYLWCYCLSYGNIFFFSMGLVEDKKLKYSSSKLLSICPEDRQREREEKKCSEYLNYSLRKI